MKNTILIKLPTYSCEATCIITDLLDKEALKIYKKHKIVEEYENGNEGILISPDLHTYFLLIDVKYLSHNTISHELYHVVKRITEDRGVIEEEAQAWLCGHLTGVVYKFIEKKKLTIIHGR